MSDWNRLPPSDFNLPPGCYNSDPHFTDEGECEHAWPDYAANDPRELSASCEICGEQKYPEIASLQPVVTAKPLPPTPPYHCAACHWEGEADELVRSDDGMEPGRCGQCGSQQLTNLRGEQL